MSYSKKYNTLLTIAISISQKTVMKEKGPWHTSSLSYYAYTAKTRTRKCKPLQTFLHCRNMLRKKKNSLNQYISFPEERFKDIRKSTVINLKTTATRYFSTFFQVFNLQKHEANLVRRMQILKSYQYLLLVTPTTRKKKAICH